MTSISKTIETTATLPGILGWLSDMIKTGLQRGPVVVTLSRPVRSLDQNRKMWPMLKDLADQITWYAMKLSTDEWKDLVTAGWKEQDCVPGINGGVVFFGHRTSRLNKADFSELIEFIYSFGAEHGVTWSEDSELFYGEIRHGKQTNI